MTIIIALIAFGIMIAVHEAGHLIAAKLSGVLVHEFAIGMGPKLFSFKGKETVYTLRLLPIGGFCNLEGEEGESDNARAFCNAKFYQKFLILASGAVMNLILGFVILISFYSLQPQIAEPVVVNPIEETYAHEVGLQNGDRIVKINNSNIHIYPDLSFFMMNNTSDTVDLTIDRNGEKILFKDFKTTNVDGNNLIGITTKRADNTFLKTVYNAFYMEIFMGKIVFYSLWQLVTGGVSIKEASGPVGIVKEIGSAAKNGILDLFYIIALITINLGLFNLLPFPALDGGRILFLIISLIIRRKVPEKVEMGFHAIGMILLMMLMVFVTMNDVTRIFG